MFISRDQRLIASDDFERRIRRYLSPATWAKPEFCDGVVTGWTIKRGRDRWTGSHDRGVATY